MAYLLGIDLGTTGTKTVLFDTDGNAAASHTVEYDLIQPQNGWAEQHPEDWWKAAVETIRAVLAKSGVKPEDIAGIGISGQMHGLVMLDDAGAVIRPAILWCDGRTGKQCAEITERVGKERLIQISANPALTGFTAGKILWVRQNEPENYARCRQIMLPKDYLRYKLTGVFATDISDASGTNLLDVPNRCWSQEILEKLEISPELMPPIYESPDVTGTVTAQAAQEAGLAQGTIVVGGAADNMAAAVGTGVVSPNSAFTTIGTSGVIFAHSRQVTIDPQGRVHTFCAAVPGEWTVMSCTLAAGMSLKWFRDNFCEVEKAEAEKQGIDPYVLMDRAAEKIPVGSDRLLYLPYLMGERSPILDEKARGVFFGLSGFHTKAHLIRAVMEGVMYSQRQCLDVLHGMSVKPAEMLACGGGGSSPLWRQMMADLYGCPVTTVKHNGGPALGVAILAGVGAGIYPSVAEGCARVISKNEPQQPNPQAQQQYEGFYRLYCSLYPQLQSKFQELAQMI